MHNFLVEIIRSINTKLSITAKPKRSGLFAPSANRWRSVNRGKASDHRVALSTLSMRTECAAKPFAHTIACMQMLASSSFVCVHHHQYSQDIRHHRIAVVGSARARQSSVAACASVCVCACVCTFALTVTYLFLITTLCSLSLPRSYLYYNLFIVILFMFFCCTGIFVPLYPPPTILQ